MAKHHLDRLKTLDRLIRTKATGSPKQLAKKMEISERTLFRLIDCLRSLGAPVVYCKNRACYYYEEEGLINFCFQKAISATDN
jgi:predicted DNA-binding transcriptional regulator YafY